MADTDSDAFTPDPVQGAQIGYNVEVPGAGRYYIWVRGYTTGTMDNTLHVGFDNTCTFGQTGTGGGAIYVTNGTRDYAITLSALGQSRVHAWDAGAGQWTN